MADYLVGWLVGWTVGRSVGQSVGRSVSQGFAVQNYVVPTRNDRELTQHDCIIFVATCLEVVQIVRLVSGTGVPTVERSSISYLGSYIYRQS
jgi:hypothetical protein